MPCIIGKRIEFTNSDKKFLCKKRSNMGKLHIIDHPMIAHKLTLMRDKDTGAKDFRQLLNEISMLMGYEITRDLPTEDVAIETPVSRMAAKKISGKKLAIVPILRAGLGMVDGLLSLIPVAKVGHIGLYRDPDTHTPVEYYCKMPPDINERIVILVPPSSSCAWWERLREQNLCWNSIRM